MGQQTLILGSKFLLQACWALSFGQVRPKTHGQCSSLVAQACPSCDPRNCAAPPQRRPQAYRNFNGCCSIDAALPTQPSDLGRAGSHEAAAKDQHPPMYLYLAPYSLYHGVS